MMLRKKAKQNPLLSCLITLLAIVGVLLACFLFCTVVFQLNQNANQAINTYVINLVLG